MRYHAFFRLENFLMLNQADFSNGDLLTFAFCCFTEGYTFFECWLDLFRNNSANAFYNA